MANYIPNANFCGTDSFSYQIKDSFGPTGSNIASVTITVVCINDAPVAVNDTASTNRNVSVSIDVVANDTDADSGTALSGYLSVTGVVNIT